MSDVPRQTGVVDIHMQWGTRIPMRDGIHLNATLYRPAIQSAPTPVIFTLTPYVGQTYHERGTYFASHGYVFLTVDVRGRGNSGAEFNPNAEATDGYDIIEWLAQQPFCDGQVAMWGGSYQGHVQWATAKELPPHLVTIVPVAAPYRGLDSPMRNNIFTPYRLQWLNLIAGHTSQDRIFADQPFWNRQFKRWFESGTPLREIDRFLGCESPILQEWLAHPCEGPYWDRFNPTAEEYSKISIPVLTITGMYDGDQPGALMHFREHLKNAAPEARAQHYLIIGPWDHAGTRTPKAEFCGLTVGAASLIDLPKLHLQWYDWTMRGGPRPEFLQKNVAYYVMGLEEWRYADSLQQITSHAHAWYLQSTVNPTDVFQSGSLVEQPPTTSEPDSYIYDPRDLGWSELECLIDPEARTDQRMIHASIGQQLIYHSAPFADDTTICGFFQLSVWLSIDQPDTDFRASVHEIGLDGSSILLTDDVLRARYRESHREGKLIESTAPLRYDFERFMFVARHLRKGHRLRLVIGPINSIHSQKNHNTGGAVAEESRRDARPVKVQLFHDPAHPSALRVPYGRVER